MEPTASELTYLQDHIDDTRIPEIIISSIVCGIITSACVCLRFFSRFLNRAGVGKDDICLVIGLVSLGLLLRVKASSEGSNSEDRSCILVILSSSA